MQVKYKCSSTIGTPLPSEGPVDYIRRIGYEVDRIEAVLERHIMWYTHKSPNAAECPICATFVLLRGLSKEYEGMLGPIAGTLDSDSATFDGEGEPLNMPSPVLDIQE